MEPRPWSKAKFLGVYWACQGAVAYLMWPLLVGEAWDNGLLASLAYLGSIGPVLLAIMAAQWILLAPISKPGASSSEGLARWSRGAMGGLAIGAMAGYAWSLVVVVLAQGDSRERLDALGLLGVSPWCFIIPFGVVSPIGAVILARRRTVPVMLTIALSACLAASLALGIVLGLMGLFVTVLGAKRVLFAVPSDDPERYWWIWAVVVMGMAWAAATPLLLVFFRGRDRNSAVARLSSRLFLGTLIEAAAIIPIDVMVRRKSGCYCGEGTLWALTICWGVGTVVLGPAIWLVPMGRRRKRWLAGRCPVCEYDMRGCAGAERCPECGAGWRPGPAMPPSCP